MMHAGGIPPRITPPGQRGNPQLLYHKLRGNILLPRLDQCHPAENTPHVTPVDTHRRTTAKIRMYHRGTSDLLVARL
jgi:hypothetical protein